MNILKEINDGDSMRDFIINLRRNITFYIKHSDELADIGENTTDLINFSVKLDKVLSMYEKDTVPNWFNSINPYLFVSNGFPYTKPLFNWLLSFKEWVEILLSKQYVVYDKDTVMEISTGNTYTALEWRNKMM